MSRTVLVTGCSSGIGHATARRFLADGWVVYATARDSNDLDDLAARGAETARLDVTSAADAERVVERVVHEQGRLDCLVNNAGYGQTGPVEDVPTDAVREQFDVNAFGPHRLLRAALPQMRRQGAGTVVNVLSVNDRFPFAGSGVYSASKAALATLTEAARQEVHEFGIDVVGVEPAFVATEFYDRLLAELDDFEHSPAYADLYDLLERFGAMEGGGPGISSPEAVAETIHEAATSDDPKRRYEVGSLAKLGRVLAVVLPESWRTPALRAGVDLATSGPAKHLLGWWDARAGASRERPGDRPGGSRRRRRGRP